MHRIISTSIAHRRGCEKVPCDDLFYMWILSDPSRLLNLPFTLAVLLTSRASGASTKSLMTGGHFITRLARSYGILIADVIAHLRPMPPTCAQGRYLESMRPPLEITEEEDEEEEPLVRPTRQRRLEKDVHPPPQPCPAPQPVDIQATLRNIVARMTRLEDQQMWMAEALRELLLHVGRDPPPFPTTGHDDEAGPSGTQHDGDE
ncbi:hypothetical protein L2E82_23243 [Cichorium intybus]|uniref:Uncharacterized protein n=1 Tax=Cichorium intybus TaxID=13427 RepID=A0ACB9E0U5_CICIN|nr:hypothetical protein L2E82_23243 [Cichorium intybus]